MARKELPGGNITGTCHPPRAGRGARGASGGRPRDRAHLRLGGRVL